MKLGKRIPVEPLDDERLTNIERRLVIEAASIRADAPSRRPLAFATGLLAAAVVVLLGWTWHTRSSQAPSVAVASEPAPQQHVGVTTEAEHSTLALDDATISSDPSTQFDVTRGPGRVVVEIAHGRIDLAVQHRTGRVLVIHAGDTDIEDIGTHFSVAYDGTTVDVRVTEGEVRVTRDHRETRVAAGSAWTSSRGLVALADLEAPVHVPATPPTVAIVTPMPARTPAVPPAPAPAHAETHAPAPARTAVAEPAHEHAATAPVDPYVELRTAIRSQPIAFDPKIDGKADVANEIAKLKLLAYSPTTVGDEASAALYRIAVLLHRPLGQDVAALDTLEIYRRRFTSGKERIPAMWLRVRIACSHSIDEECRSAAYSFQREVPTGDAAAVAIRITNAQ
jgi:FecR protein